MIFCFIVFAFQTETPGPGSYIKSTENLSDKLKRTSDSLKGYGSFASRSGRENLKLNNLSTPGAGAYDVQSVTIFKKRDHSTSFSSAFQKPIAIKLERPSSIPAPNKYNVNDELRHKKNNVCADSAFRSKTKRELSQETAKDVPPPGTYNIQVVSAVKVPFSSFKSTSQRHSFSKNKDFPG